MGWPRLRRLGAREEAALELASGALHAASKRTEQRGAMVREQLGLATLRLRRWLRPAACELERHEFSARVALGGPVICEHDPRRIVVGVRDDLGEQHPLRDVDAGLVDHGGALAVLLD